MGEKCQKCGPSTVPDKAFVFENWNIVPAELHESCISFASSKYNELAYGNVLLCGQENSKGLDRLVHLHRLSRAIVSCFALITHVGD